MAGSEERRKILDTATLVPLGIVVTVCGGILGGGIWLNDKFGEIATSFTTVNFRLEKIEERIAYPWTIERMRSWRDLLAATNPGISVPQVTRD